MPRFLSIVCEKRSKRKKNRSKEGNGFGPVPSMEGKVRSPVASRDRNEAGKIPSTDGHGVPSSSQFVWGKPKSTPLPHFSKSFTSPFGNNDKTRVVPNAVVADGNDAKDAPCKNGCLSGERNQECNDTKHRKNEKLVNSGEELGKNDEDLVKNDEELGNNDVNRAIEVVDRVREASGVAVENVLTEKRVCDDDTQEGSRENLIENGENLVENDGDLIKNEETRAIEVIGVREESEVAEQNILTRKMFCDDDTQEENSEFLINYGENLVKIDGDLISKDEYRAIEVLGVREVKEIAEQNVLEENISCDDTQQWNGENLTKNGRSLVNNDEKRASEEIGVADKIVSAKKNSWDGTQHGNNENLVNDDENLGSNDENLFKTDEGLVSHNENRAIEEVRLKEERVLAERNVLTEKINVNQEFIMEVRRSGIGEKGILKSIRVRCDQVDGRPTLAEDVDRVKSYSCSRELLQKDMMEGCVILTNAHDNRAMILNMRFIPISGWNKVKTTRGHSEYGSVAEAESECYLKNICEEVFLRSPRDVNYSPGTSQSDFLDAKDDLFTEDEGQSTWSINVRLHAELDDLRSKYSKEIEERTRAEAALSLWQNLWEEMMGKFSLVGMSLPSIEMDGPQQGTKDTIANVIDDVFGQLIDAKTVKNSIIAKLEHEFKELIVDKSIEISRLHNKVKYYELVNHEMSQRNQEAMELTRRQQQTQKKRKRWMWCSFAVSVVISTTALAYVYTPWTETKDWVPSLCTRSNAHRMGSDSI